MEKIEFQLPSGHSSRYFLADATFLRDGRPKPVVIFNHGFKGYKDWGPFNLIAEKFANAGFVFIKMNFSHNGTTIEHPTEFVDLQAFGENNFSKELDDTGVLIDHLCQQKLPVDDINFDVKQLSIVGHSRGGASALLKAGEETRLNKVVTWSAVSDLESQYSLEEIEMWKKLGTIYVHNSRTQQEMPLNYQLVEDYHLHRNRLNVPSVVKKLSIPLLVIHGSADETVPVANAYELKKWNPEIQLEIIEGANHTFGGTEPYLAAELPEDFEKVVDLTIDFLK